MSGCEIEVGFGGFAGFAGQTGVNLKRAAKARVLGGSSQDL